MDDGHDSDRGTSQWVSQLSLACQALRNTSPELIATLTVVLGPFADSGQGAALLDVSRRIAEEYGLRVETSARGKSVCVRIRRRT